MSGGHDHGSGHNLKTKSSLRSDFLEPEDLKRAKENKILANA